uniref:Dharma n=1 Tax=Mastacembelus armatus TaxID=205130 RepID=A0A7N9AKY9_9TELE
MDLGGIMDGSRVSDFSIERILSPQLGHKPQVEFSPDEYLQGFPGRFSLDCGNLEPPAPVPMPVPVPGCLQYRGMGCVEACYPCGAGFHRTDFTSIYPNSGAGVSSQSQHRQKARTRTVFTDSQSRQLEALFELTDYPAVEARAEVARRSGLSEETVRVWFKNRRARRKRQCSGSKVKSPGLTFLTKISARKQDQYVQEKKIKTYLSGSSRI